MFQRPRLGETEGDLLKQQEEFFRASGKPSKLPTRGLEDGNDSSKDCNLFQVHDIKEKGSSHSTSNFEFKRKTTNGFPYTFTIDLHDTQKKRNGKSLFAIAMEKKERKKHGNEETIQSVTPITDALNKKMFSDTISGSDITELKRIINEENVKKLSQMSQSEIFMEQEKLMNTLEPNVIKFLKTRSKMSALKASNVDVTESANNNKSNMVEETQIKNQLGNYLDSKWIDMDFVEVEKLKWIGDIPDNVVLEPNQPYSARFDFKGDLLPFKTDIDVRTSLYHHGDEPERPGYTIQELYQLSRSQVLQQRILALNTLANIIRKTKLGYYDNCFNGHLLHKLLDSDLFFLIRFSIDDTAMVSASVFCLHYLICNECDEFCLDKLLGVTNLDKQPWLSVNSTKLPKGEEGELKDHLVISIDLIKGVMRTDLLTRLSYILNMCSPNQETIARIINCLIRISRHSLEASLTILKVPNLLKGVYMNLTSNKPLYQGVKLFRVMSGQTFQVAKAIIEEYDIRFLISFLEEDELAGFSKKDFFMLKLETIYLWRNLLIHELYMTHFQSWYPCFRRLLFFYSEKVDINSTSEFDFELFSAIVSLIIICNQKRVLSESSVTSTMRICLEKWLSQLIQKRNQYSFSVSKALGSTLRYFITHYNAFGVTATDLAFIEKINSILKVFLESEICQEMGSGLLKCSHILRPLKEVFRDPDSLPSLGSVYQGGGEFLNIIHKSSSFPFFTSLAQYLRTVCGITLESRGVLKLFLECNAIKNYLKTLLKKQMASSNWFAQFETYFVSELLQLLLIIRSEKALKLAFRLLPSLRVDDSKAAEMLEMILNSENWNMGNLFPKQEVSEYINVLLEKEPRQNHQGNLVGEEWAYRMLALLRDKGDHYHIVQNLKFISFVLSRGDGFFDRVSPSHRYYYTCYVFLVDSVVFDEEAQSELEIIYKDIILSKDKIKLDVKLDNKKCFYDLYTELITQYAGISYGLSVFARFILFPLQNNQDVAFRKLIWFEYLHVLRVVTLPYPLDNFIKLKCFIEPCESDESLLIAYMNALCNQVITKARNPFIYYIAVGNIKQLLISECQNQKLTTFIKNKIDALKNAELKNDILNFSLLVEESR